MSADFDTAILGTTPEANRATRSAAMTAIRRIEASHSALVAALEAILADKRWAKTNLTIPQLAQAEAAIALAKGGAQ